MLFFEASDRLIPHLRRLRFPRDEPERGLCAKGIAKGAKENQSRDAAEVFRTKHRAGLLCWHGLHTCCGSGQSSHSAMPRPKIHSLSSSDRKCSSSVNNVKHFL